MKEVIDINKFATVDDVASNSGPITVCFEDTTHGGIKIIMCLMNEIYYPGDKSPAYNVCYFRSMCVDSAKCYRSDKYDSRKDAAKDSIMQALNIGKKLTVVDLNFEKLEIVINNEKSSK